jgi:maltose alpha-D-glucosyltransferase/alpha-amylase
VLQHGEELFRVFDEIERLPDAGRQLRCHGDYHLGQVLVTEGDIVILDFEGEPSRPLRERRLKSSPLRDVAGMLRSFSYAALTGLGAATSTRPDDIERLAPWAEMWEEWVRGIFIAAYLTATRDATFLPARTEHRDLLLAALQMDKAFYELAYEFNNRPDWVHIPLAGLLRLRSARRDAPFTTA